MKRFVWTLGIMITGAAIAIAQPPGGPRGGGQGGRDQGPPGGGRGGDFQPPPNPIVETLDADHDHVISAEEIQNSPAALARLDTNKDGKLTEDEFRPRPPGGGPPGARGGGQGGRGDAGRGDTPRGNGQRNQGGGRGQGGGPDGGPGGPGGRGPEGAGPGGPPGPERFIEHAMQFDADKDGKLSRDELAKFADDFAQRRGGPGGPGGRPDGPGGRDGNGGPDSGNRTERPRRPE